jgi:hypothetical protein
MFQEIHWVRTSYSRGQMVVTSCSGSPVVQHFVFIGCSGSAFCVPRDLLGQHFMFWRSNDRHFMFKRSSGNHFTFTRSSGPALHEYIQDIQWSEIHVLQFQWVSTLGSRGKMIRKSSSGQDFLLKKSSGQHFVFKRLNGHNFMFKRPYDQRFMLKR